MGKYEYKVLPTPRRAKRAKGVKGEPARFAHALTDVMNLEAAEGWEFFKSETLPMESKSGMFKGLTETFQSVLIFRRSLEDDDQGEILSVIPPIAVREPEVTPPKEIEPPVSSKDSTMKAVDEVVEAEKKALTFDEGNIDPLKNLVEGHRGQKASE